MNGSGPVENNFQMDGVSINSIAGFSANDISGIYPGVAVPSPDAIEEFKVQTSNFDASYGRNSGANVNVVTKSGTNQFHGTAFEYLRNSIFNADDYFYPKHRAGEPARQALNQNQFGGTIGGPIRKNKLFYFLSLSGDALEKRGGPQHSPGIRYQHDADPVRNAEHRQNIDVGADLGGAELSR